MRASGNNAQLPFALVDKRAAAVHVFDAQGRWQGSAPVLLGLAQNAVASTTLAGQAGGDFQFQDATDLAVGSVAASGFDAAGGAMSGEGSSGINAGGDIQIRNLAGDLTLGAGMAATNIDLVIAGRLQNPANAGLSASVPIGGVVGTRIAVHGQCAIPTTAVAG